MKFTHLRILLVLLLMSLSGVSQTVNGQRTELEDAHEHVDNNNFLMAIPIYKVELKKDPDNKKIKYWLGICYLHTRLNYGLALSYLEDYSKDPKGEEDVWLYLGQAYQLNYRLAEAISAFQRFKSLKPKRGAEADRFIEQCDNAIKFMRLPNNITFQNLGKEINSEEPDYYPFINKDETMLAFTSRRKDNVGGKKVEIDGYRSSDIYLSTSTNGAWAAAKNAGKIVNSSLDEQVVGLRSDGLEMYIYEDHIDKFGDIYVANRKDAESEFSKPKVFMPNINDKFETSGSLSEDGTIMFFTRREKMGDQSDLYLCRKLPTGIWALPQKLPDFVNTPYNEEAPYLSYDCKTLYFASQGHNSMGGYDLFKTTFDEQKNTFTPPVNMGYPINSTDDDRSICVTHDNRLAYISAFRPNGFGDLDVYRIRFNDTEQKNKVYRGRIFLGDTIVNNQPHNYAITMIATNEQNKLEYTFTPHSKTGNFLMILPAGNYKLTINSRSYEKLEEKLTVSDIGNTEEETKKNFLLRIKY